MLQIPAPLALIATIILLTPALAGCLTPSGIDDIRIAFTFRDTDLNPDKDPELLAAWIAAETGRPTQIYTVDDGTAALSALRFGQADIAILDGAAAWIGWQRFGLEAIAAEKLSDGRTYYDAVAWVRADSDIQTAADLAGRDSCHTGMLKSAGMLMPVAYLIQQDIIDTSGYPDEITAVETIVNDFFGTATIGGAYNDYEGALRCLSEGVGDVAFVRDTTPADFCGDDARSWCLPSDGYRALFTAGPSPSHPVMVSPELDATTRTSLAAALVNLETDEQGRAILENVLEAPGLVAVDTEEHLGAYGTLVAALPGFVAWTEEKNGL